MVNVLKLSAKEKIIQIMVFTRIELTTSALLIVGVRGYLQDHSGDLINTHTYTLHTYTHTKTHLVLESRAHLCVHCPIWHLQR